MKRWTLLTLSLALVFLLAACGTENPGTNNTNSGMGSNPDNSLGDAMVGGNLVVDKGFVVATTPAGG